MKYLLLASLVLLLPAVAFAQTRVGPLVVGNNLAEIAKGGSAAQQAALVNLGINAGLLSPLAAAPTGTGSVVLSTGGAFDVSHATGLTSGQVTGALGFAPFPSSGGTLTGALTVPGVTNTGNATVAGTINTNSSQGFQQNGMTVLNVLNGTPYQEGVFLGPRSGQSAPANIAYGTVGIGPDALRSLTRVNGENVAVGPFTCEFVTNGYGNTCVGEHAIGFDNPSYVTVLGNDAMRDTVGNNNSTGIGATAQVDGVGSSNTSLGAFSLHGNAGSITIMGSATVGDVLNINFTTTNSSVTGLPTSASYTVKAGDTLASIASNLASAVNSLNVTYTLPDGNTTQVENGAQLGAIVLANGAQTNVVSLHFPGGNAEGWAISATTSCAGACTETLTYAAPFSGTDNIAVGVSAMQAGSATSAFGNIAVGDGALNWLAGSASGNTAVGLNAGAGLVGGNNNILIGNGAGQSLNPGGTNGWNVVVGFQAGQNMTTGQFNTIIGAGYNSTSCITTGTQNIEIGIGACVPSATGTKQISIGNFIFGTNAILAGSGSVAAGRVGIGTAAPNAALTVGDAGGGNDDAHLGVLQSTLPVTSNGSLDAHASDVAGTETEGSSSTGFTLTFGHSWSTTPHCVVSSPNGATFTSYSASTTALTISNASASGNQYSYVCVQ